MNKALHHSITCMFLIIVFFAGAYKLQSQNIGRFELPHYDQLPNRQIKKIFQDSEGLIWYCTEDGLCRDDGYNIQIFRSDFKTPDVIKHNHITCITEDLSGKIWFGTLRGAYILDKNDYRITPIEGYGFDSWSINEIKATSDGLVYIATNNKVYRIKSRFFSKTLKRTNYGLHCKKADYVGSTSNKNVSFPSIGRSRLLPPHWYGTRTTISSGLPHTATDSSVSAPMPETAAASMSPYGKKP